MNDWIIKIVDPGYKITRDIYIFRRLPNYDIEFINGTIGKAGEDLRDKPSLELNPEQLQALANALNDNGFKPQQGFVEGELQATKEHLKDLRTLLKL